MTNLLLFGSPGSGKGTLCEDLRGQGYAIIGTGDKLREEIRAETPLGLRVKECVANGILMPDDLAYEFVTREIEKAAPPFVLEGFPNTLNQYEMIRDYFKKRGLKVKLIVLECPQNIAMERMLARSVCQKCAKVYNRIFKPPKNEGECEKCGGSVLPRKDDNEECIKRRLVNFYERTYPILEIAKTHFQWSSGV